MPDFAVHFFICNLFISVLVGLMLLVRKLSDSLLSGQARYRIWFLLPVVLMFPFLPVRPAKFLSYILQIKFFPFKNSPGIAHILQISPGLDPFSGNWIHDFGVSVSRDTASSVPWLLAGIWLLGMLLLLICMGYSRLTLYRIERSALPLQNEKLRELYRNCKQELKLTRRIFLYSTAFFHSPVTMGFFRPRIFIPVHLISDYNETDMRYMLLHELQHCKQRDALMNGLMNLSVIVYWFNPLIWYAAGQVRTDREVACDSSVLQILGPDEYIHYGNTLLNFAEKISRSPFSLAMGLGGARQLKKRILNIVRYHPMSRRMRLKERVFLLMTAILLLEAAAFIPVRAASDMTGLPKGAAVQETDLSSFFDGYSGSFVLYHLETDTWEIYNEALAQKRVSPDSTCKIYSALFALEHRYITPENSALKWDGQVRQLPQWNQDQTLSRALQNSVNWYFQTLDEKAGLSALKDFYREIGYGNHDLSGGASEYWLESSLLISPLEQVELLKNLYTNEFHFQPENIRAVKEALRIFDGQSSLYGKTGTGNINGQDVNGWFIGYDEANDGTWFFAVNIQGDTEANGKTASQIALDILNAKQLLP